MCVITGTQSSANRFNGIPIMKVIFFIECSCKDVHQDVDLQAFTNLLQVLNFPRDARDFNHLRHQNFRYVNTIVVRGSCGYRNVCFKQALHSVQRIIEDGRSQKPTKFPNTLWKYTT